MSSKETMKKRVLVPDFPTDQELEKVVCRIHALLGRIWGHARDGDIDLEAQAQDEFRTLVTDEMRNRLRIYLMPYTLFLGEIPRLELLLLEEEKRRYRAMHYLFQGD